MPTNNNLRPTDIRVLDDVFDLGGGYVLDFSNQTFAEFFEDELGINIYDPQYAQSGGSKAKRLRFFLRRADPALALKTLMALWEYRQAASASLQKAELPKETAEAFRRIVERLGGTPPRVPEPVSNTQARFDPIRIAELNTRLISISQLAPHPRGFAFEKFLKDLFDVYGLDGRASFRLQGEQIDGSFQVADHTYLLEAKWANLPTDAAALRSFNAKVEDKAKWSRGLFVSNSGFAEDGLAAFGRRKSVICMDGLDLHEILDQQLDFAEVVALKARRSAETGRSFVRIRDLRLHQTQSR